MNQRPSFLISIDCNSVFEFKLLCKQYHATYTNGSKINTTYTNGSKINIIKVYLYVQVNFAYAIQI